MLVALSIQSIALIDSLQLAFGSGMTCLTGETGAGKSILLDAIGLVLGERGDTALIRQDQPSLAVEALFQIPVDRESDVCDRLNEWGVDCDGELVISRELHRSGRNVCRINGKMATVQMLRDIGDRLVEQHGQHEAHTLTRPAVQIRLLDSYGRLESLVERVRQAYTLWRDAHTAWSTAHMDEQERMRRMDMLTFQVEEIDAAKLDAAEEAQLREERKRLQHATRIQQNVHAALQALNGGDGERGASAWLSEAVQRLEAVVSYDATLVEAESLLQTALVHADEAAISLSRHIDAVEDDPARLEDIENRLMLIRSLQRKYGASIDEVLTHAEVARSELDALTRHEERLLDLERALAQTETSLRDVSVALHDARVKAANRLALAIEDTLHDLRMENAQFRIDVMGADGEDLAGYGPTGHDTVTFLFTANQGEAVRPLSKVASGGELSRLLLGIKSVLADVDDVDTLIFDEIDQGVSGLAAERVAWRLQDLSQSRQVLCVTHSPQVAAVAANHFHIVKHESATGTATSVSVLDREGRAAEIARLIGGSLSDVTAMAHAQALLEKAIPKNPRF